ncbi:hypothetical protein AB0N05_33305 [Nocardia sp. NPDC051030]|uniref:hypothetical protein n=1 Tax=Nocardia sp. NPDC051030 TaxID=3155162 RepID=UPI003431B442
MNYQYGYGTGAPANQGSSGFTARTAAVLGAIAGSAAGVGTVVSIVVVSDVTPSEHASSDLPDLSGVIILMFGLLAIMAAIVGVLFLAGAALLFARKTAGRVLLIVASPTGLALNFLAFGLDPNLVRIAAALLCVAILGFAVVPSTGRWIAAGKQLRLPQPAGYMPYPQY